MCSKHESKFLLCFAALAILLEASVCIVISALLFVENTIEIRNGNETKEILESIIPLAIKGALNGTRKENTTTQNEFLQFFATVNIETFAYAGIKETQIWYFVHTVIEGLWWVSGTILLGVAFKKNLYVGAYGYILPALLATIIVCVKDAAGFCFFIIKLFNESSPDPDPAEFMNKFFVPLWFAKAFLFWILNVFLFTKLLMSYNYLSQTHKRTGQLEDQYHLNINDGGRNTYLSGENFSMKDGYISNNKRYSNTFDNYAYDGDPNPRHIMGDNKRLNPLQQGVNGYNNTGNGKPFNYLQPNGDFTYPNKGIYANNEKDNGKYSHYDNAYRNQQRDVPAVVDAFPKQYVKNENKYRDDFHKESDAVIDRSRYQYPPPNSREKPLNTNLNYSYHPEQNGVSKINPLYEPSQRMDATQHSPSYANPSVPSSSYLIPRAHLPQHNARF